MSDPELRDGVVAQFIGLRPDGGAAVVVITRTEAALNRGTEVVMSSELLPGEDPALLNGPSRVERYEVTDSWLPISTS